ncbi:hypothetical protein ARTHRO9V_130188 [Arthrobacter sp. 9V]|uniref:hypothetical protein n=1 Tax=Arthrobacter sp. 9V TaxID=2653132 RepID=UPI0012F42F3B|nr:hypothetical protein [Arthrobacter sp. 9V]VXB24487.1 hypothetical protein ARTHRO9V_130188 [Arthrobacter sp. 9V]
MTAIIRAIGATFSDTLPKARAILAKDNFTRAAGTVLGSTEIGGKTWAAVHNAEAPALTGTALRVKAIEAGKSGCLIDLGIPAAEVEAVWAANGTTVQTGLAGVMVRANSAGTSGFFFGPAYIGAGSSRWLLARLDGGVLTWLLNGPASGAADRPVLGDRFSLRCNGSTIEGRVNGMTLLTLTDAAYATATRAGLIAIGSAGGNTQSDFDTFKALPA